MKTYSAASGPPVSVIERAVALGDEEAAVGRDRRGEAQRRRAFGVAFLGGARDRVAVVGGSTPRSFSVWKITGIMRKVEPLPMPVVKNSTRKLTKKPAKLLPAPGSAVRCGQEVQHADTRRRPSRRSSRSVTRAPPILSASQPPNGRTTAPTSGPSQA